MEDTNHAHGVLDEDVYNFNETGFMMGVASTSKVVTALTLLVGRLLFSQGTESG